MLLEVMLSERGAPQAMKRRSFRRASWSVAGTVLVGMCAALMGFGSTGRAAAAGLQGASGEEYIAVACMGNLEYFRAHKYAWKWIGDKLGVKTSYIGPAEYDVPGQIAAFDQAIARQPKGIAVFGVEASLKPEIDKAVAAGIPVVTFSGDVPDSKRSAFVGTNQHQLGFFGGKKLAELLEGKGDVAILSLPGVSMFDAREQGYKDAFAASPGIKVVQTGDTKADTVTAISTAKAIMQRFPNLSAFACTDSTGGIAAATAVAGGGATGSSLCSLRM
jgi:ribose transport system substrate-binding protein